MARIPSSSASDDDNGEERHTLVPQIETGKPPSPHSALEIGRFPACRRGFFSGTRRVLLLLLLSSVLVSLFLVLLLLFSRNAASVIRVDSALDPMRESELRALNLLRIQQSALLKLWNRTRPAAAALNSTSTNTDLSKTASFDEFRSALVEQIKLNAQIQNALLSSHKAVNYSSGASDDNVDLGITDPGFDPCKKVERPADRRTIEWKPKKDRYLLAICLSGQMSNHLICLEKHMFFAALLDRVLVLPSPKFDYQYDSVLDIRHINECFGRKVVITFDQFSEAMKDKMKINRFICYIASPPCYLDEEHIKKLKDLGLSLGKIEAAWPEDAKLKKEKKRVVGDIRPKFSSDAEVIAIGDVFYADVEEEWVMQPGGPLAHKCMTVIQPSRLIFLTAQRFVQTFLGSNFAALHFRRHGFLKFW